MISNFIVPLILGIFVGQEFQEIPRVRTYIELGIKKIIQISNEMSENVNK